MGGAINIKVAKEYTNDISISNCTFEENSSAQFGNAVYVTQGYGIKLKNCDFTGNYCTGDKDGINQSKTSCIYLDNCNLKLEDCSFLNPLATCSIYSNSTGYTELSGKIVVDKWYVNSLPANPDTSIKINSGFNTDYTNINFDFNSYYDATFSYLMTQNEGCEISTGDIISCLDIVNMGYEWQDSETSGKHYVKIQEVGSSNINPGITVDNGHVVEYFIQSPQSPISLASFSPEQIYLNVIIDTVVQQIDDDTKPKSVNLYYASETQEDSNAKIECSGSVYSGQYKITITDPLYPDNYYFIIESEYEGVKSKQRIDFKIVE